MNAVFTISVLQSSDAGIKAIKVFNNAVKKHGRLKYKRFNDGPDIDLFNSSRIKTCYVAKIAKTVSMKSFTFEIRSVLEGKEILDVSIDFFEYICKEIGESVEYCLSLKTMQSEKNGCQTIYTNKTFIKNISLFPFFYEDNRQIFVDSSDENDIKLVYKCLGVEGGNVNITPQIEENLKNNGLTAETLGNLSFCGSAHIYLYIDQFFEIGGSKK